VYVPVDWVCPETQEWWSKTSKTSVEIRQRDCVTYINAILGKNDCKTIILWKGFEIGLVPNTSNSCWCHVESTSLLGMHINVWPKKEELTNNNKYGSSSYAVCVKGGWWEAPQQPTLSNAHWQK
jgi:hypothetical protein